MKKLLLLPLVALVAAGCSTTEYYQDDLAVAQRLDDDAPPQQHIQRTERATQQAQNVTRAQYEQRQDVKDMQAQLDDIDQRIDSLESDMETMSASEREQTAQELSDLRERQRRAESMLNEAEGSSPAAFVEVRDELRDVVNALEIGVYRVLVRDSAQPAPGETLE